MSEDERTEAVACDGSGGYHATARQAQNRSDGGGTVRRLLVAQAAAMVLAGVALLVFGMWSLDLYFVVAFLSFLGLRIVLAPTDGVPTWWTRLNWVVRAGFVVFGYHVLSSLPELLP